MKFNGLYFSTNTLISGSIGYTACYYYSDFNFLWYLIGAVPAAFILSFERKKDVH